MADRLTDLPHIGAKTQENLKALGIHTPEDLLFYLPLRYEDLTHFTPIAEAEHGSWCLIRGQVVKSEIRQAARRSLLVWIADDTATLMLRFFYFGKPMVARFIEGAEVEVYGEVRHHRGEFTMIHPKVNFDHEKTLQTDALTPVYPLVKGVTQTLIRKLVKVAWEHCQPQSYLPESVMEEMDCIPFDVALHQMHYPTVGEDGEKKTQAQRSLALEELCAHSLAFERVRQQRLQQTGLKLTENDSIYIAMLAALPYQLTNAQQRVIDEIYTDMRRGVPMWRLVQGDVGAGKTAVAMAAVALGVDSGWQCAVMAPTEILAEQHYRVFSEVLGGLGVAVWYVRGAMTASEKRATHAAIRNGEAQVVIGTHALFQDSVAFDNLGLVVVDEQHRFGVDQRKRLMQKGKVMPHQLTMTATPIPRTMAMCYYGYLDHSILDELPPGRKPITTSVIGDHRRAEVIERMGRFVKEGRQAYWVCPLIEESEMLECQTAMDTQEHIAQVLSEFRVGLAHGRMTSAEKEAVMQDFKAGNLDILVATTVIEVGVDVPNAGLIVLDNAERLGLSQLHQLRGRVGRGSAASFCILLYQNPLSTRSRKRLEVIRSNQDGFKIAEEDLALRGPGELLGVRQTGDIRFRIVDLQQDTDLIETVQRRIGIWQGMMNADSQKKLVERWLKQVDEAGTV
jgi:ATP-dependent DNA helicase RecG